MCWNSQCVLTNLVPLFFSFGIVLLKVTPRCQLSFVRVGVKGIGRLSLDHLSASGRVRKLASSRDFGQNTAYAFVHSKTIRVIRRLLLVDTTSHKSDAVIHGPLISVGFGSIAHMYVWG